MGVANGKRVPSSGVCGAIPILIGQERFYVDIFMIALNGYEMVLGCQWLRTLGPILWDFTVKSVSF